MNSQKPGSDKYEAFALRRDKTLLIIGCIIVLGVGLASIIVDIKNPEIALAVLTVGGGLLGAPAILRLDEMRPRKK